MRYLYITALVLGLLLASSESATYLPNIAGLVLFVYGCFNIDSKKQTEP